MPYDSGGNFSLVPSYLAVTGQVVQPVQHNPPFEDIASAGLSAVLVRDGRAPMTGNLNHGGFKATNMADGTLATDGVTKQQLGWEQIGAGSGGNGPGVYSGTGAATFDLTNLSAYRMIELRGFVYTSTTTAVYMRTSSNNGVSYDSGASDYLLQWDGYFNGAVADIGQSTSNLLSLCGSQSIVASAGAGMSFRVLLTQFNQASNGFVLAETGINIGSLIPYKIYGVRAQSTARNAFRLLPGGGTFSYFIEARGLRG